MGKTITRFVALLLAITLLVPVGASAAVDTPFGPGAVPLSDAEMAEVEGEFSPLVTSAVAGGLISTASYLITTPASQWTLGGAVRHAIAGAVSGLAGYFLR
ncbi:MAG TPA: hypothetical protein GX008_07965 [Firmicutes bacterium]|jgi:hypothetical protein|nr:hypothetical protein [Bacillota bacterium]